jgi:2-(1,2-epoxy-1,2-dihydrophenyl)acetyl-CoA isomerase
VSDRAAIWSIEDGLARITLTRPAARNAINAAMHAQLRAALDAIEADTGVHAVILTGAGQAFCAGQDLAERHAMLAVGEVDLSASLEKDYNPLVRRLAALPCPVIAAVNGIASGAGAAIAIGCDIVLAGRSARFQFPFGKVALGPDSGTSWLLPRLVGTHRALALTLTGEAVDAETACRWGLVWRVVDDDALLDEALEIARMLAERPAPALASIKQLMRAGAASDFATALEAERDMQGQRGRHPDYREAINAFVEKRPARFAREEQEV